MLPAAVGCEPVRTLLSIAQEPVLVHCEEVSMLYIEYCCTRTVNEK